MQHPAAEGVGGPGRMVSVVIAAYQQAAFVGEAVRSALAQREPGLGVQVIVVDDGSSDGTAAAARAAGADVVLEQPNSGVSAARNRGVEQATNDWVVFLDGDDRLLPGGLRRQFDVLDPEAHYAFGRSRLIDADGALLPQGAPEPARGGELFLRTLQRSWVCPPSAMIVSRAALADIGPWNSTFDNRGEDLDVLLRLTRRFRGIDHEAVITDYRLHGAMRSRSYQELLTGILAVLAEHAPDAGDPAARRARAEGEQHYRATYEPKIAVTAWAGAVRSGQGRAAATRQLLRVLAAHPLASSRLAAAGRLRRRNHRA